jgi:DNA-binding MarR family transcriptional regulator
MLSTSAMTNWLERLEKRGLIARTMDLNPTNPAPRVA